MSYKVIISNSIMQKGKPATAGSKMLENFISPIDATVVERLKAAGVEILGTGMSDEFDISLLLGGQTNLTSDNGLVNLIANGKADFAICNDYTGAIGSAAASQDLYYIHPTYGTVSRYGLIQAVSSIDQIGVLCTNIDIGFDVLDIISGYDSKDGAMKQGDGSLASSEKQRNHPLASTASNVSEVKPKFAEIYTQIMQIICCAELSNNISRYDGVKYGYRTESYNGLQEMYMNTRTEAFGEDIKLAAILGTMILSHENYTRYYEKATCLRRLIMDSMKFDTYDVTVGRGDDSSAMILLSRLCGLPSITIGDCTYVANKGNEPIIRETCKASVLSNNS